MREVVVAPGDWDVAVGDTEGPQVIVAGPGTGKTGFLARRALHLIDSGVPPEAVLLLSFSRRGASDLRLRVTGALSRSFTVVAASTFHSLALRIVESHGSAGDWPRVPTLLTGPEQVALVAELLAEEDPDAWPLPFRPLLTARGFAEEVADFVLRAAERLTGPNELADMGRDDWRALPAFLGRYRKRLIERNRIDYGTLQLEALRLLDTPGIEVRNQFSHVLVDEYQDTTVAQAALAEGMAARHRNLTVAGDPYQSIYSFRGAEVTNIAEFAERFTDADGRPARRLVLETSFRVPRPVLEAAVRLTAGAGLPGGSGPVTPAPGPGAVETYAFDQQSSEAEWIAGELQRAHLRDATPYSSMAVLVRSKRRLLPELSRALDRRHIPHTRPDARLTDHRAIRPLLDIAEAAAGRSEPSAISRVLMGPLVGMTLGKARELEREAIADGWESVLDQLDTPVAGLIRNRSWACDRPASEGFWEIWTGVGRLARLATGNEDDRVALASFSQALDRLRDRDPTASLADYAALTRHEDFEAEPLISFQPPGSDQVTLTTLHQAKGLEFEIVILADAVEGVLPDLRSRDSILGTRHLTPAHSGDDSAYARFRIQEERRLAYTAMCRSSRRVVWTCTRSSAEAGRGAPSRFISLVAGKPIEDALERPQEPVEPTTPQEAEAWLRRRVSDPEVGAADRLAALATLAGGLGWRPVSDFAGVLPPGPDSGLLDSSPTLSPTQAESYARCPRLYAFERRLGIAGGGSVYAALGNVIHRVLEEVEKAAAANGLEHASIEDATALLDELFEPADFGGEPWASSWMGRARRILEHLYEHWPGQGPAVRFENEVELDVEGITWRGRIDRAEQRADGLHVVDYKTGSRPMKADEAESALQLGFYALASQGVVGAEFWYPGDSPGKRKSVAVRRFSMDSIGEVEAAMAAVQAGILSEDWGPVPGDHCGRCPVRIVCPSWPEGRESFEA